MFRRKLYRTLEEEVQTDVNEWLKIYNETRPHSGKYCYGKTPMQTFLDAKQIAQSKIIGTVHEVSGSETPQSVAVR